MSTRRSLSWAMGQQGGLMILQIFNLMTIARLLTPEEIGVFVVAISAMTMVQALRDMGLGNYLIRDPDLKDSTIRAVFGLSITLCVVLVGILVALRQPVANWMDAPEVANILLLVSLTILIFPLEQTAIALLRREMRFDVLARVTLVSRFIGIMTSIALALMGWSTMALVFGLLTGACLRVGLLCHAEPRHLRLGPSIYGWRPLMNFGTWITGASLAGQATVECNKLLVGAFLGTGSVAIFDRATQIPGMVRKGLFTPLSAVLLPAFSKTLREGRPIGPQAERLTAVTTGLIWPAFFVIGLLSEELVFLLLGPQWNDVAVILPWLLLAQSLLALLPQPDQILVPHGKVRRLMAVRMIQLLLVLGLGSVFLRWGLEVFAMSRCLNGLLMICTFWVALSPYIGTDLIRLARGHVKSGFVALATALPVALWKFETLGQGSFVALAGLLVLSFIFGFCALALIKHPLYEEFQRALHWLRSRRQLT